MKTDFGDTGTWGATGTGDGDTRLLRKGDVLPPYRIEGVLGEGATATVYRATHTLLGTVHALKVLLTDHPGLQARLLREGRIQAGLRHPNVVPVTDVLDFGGRAVLVLEYVEGSTLREWMPGRGLGSVESVFRQIVDGVAAAHRRGVLHRDLKPDNILVDASGTPKIADFGLGRVLAEDPQTRPGAVLGTPAYMAPEQFRGSTVDARADLWALGCILFELCTGRRAFIGRGEDLVRAITGGQVPDPMDFRQDLPSHLVDAIRACLQVDVDRRPASGSALLTLLDGGQWTGLAAEFVAPDSDQPTLTWRTERLLSTPAESSDAPERIGGFRIIRKLGSGGMGTVWEAEQAHPRRRVALKTIHPGQVSPRSRERFRFEAEALGQLLHPGIPQVYAAGEDNGLLYLVMEKVDGVRLDLWFERHRPRRREAIQLFIAICGAVHHAHLRGFVHRDLKPANILVDPAGQPRVLDFGVAQALGEGPENAGVAGTPAYMAPEQLKGDLVDVRADVYSLGVVFHQLWTGQAPTRVGWATLAGERLPPLGQFDPAYRGDLQAIVARAAEPDRERRYASAADLAADFQRHLENRPVDARVATPSYRIGRWLKRNAGATGAAAVVVVALGTGLGLAWQSYLRAEEARAAEAEQRSEADQARREAESARDRARAEKETSTAVTDFLISVLEQAHPDASLGRSVSIAEAVDRALGLVDAGALEDQPQVEVAVRRELAWLSRATFDDEERAIAQLERAAAVAERVPPSVVVASVFADLAYLTRARDLERSLALCERADAVLEQLSDLTGDEIAGVRYLFPRIIQMEGSYAEADRIYADLLALDDLSTEKRTTLQNQRARGLRVMGRNGEAAALYRLSLEEDRRLWGDRHPQVATDLVALGTTMGLGGDATGLEPLREGLDQRVEFLGPSHRRVQGAREGLVEVLVTLGRYDEAEDVLRTLAPYIADDSGFVRFMRAQIALGRGDAVGAAAIMDAGCPWTSPRSIAEWDVVRAEVEAALGNPEQALELVEGALPVFERTLGLQAPYARRAATLLERLRPD